MSSVHHQRGSPSGWPRDVRHGRRPRDVLGHDERPRGVPRPSLLAVDHLPEVIAVRMGLHEEVLEDPVDPRMDVRDLGPRSLDTSATGPLSAASDTLLLIPLPLQVLGIGFPSA